MSPADYDTDFGAWLEAQLYALATGAWDTLDIPHLCDELDDVRRHYLRELEWTLTHLIEARLVWDCAPNERSDWWQGHMNAQHSHLETFLDSAATFRPVLGPTLSRALPARHPRLAALSSPRPEPLASATPVANRSPHRALSDRAGCLAGEGTASASGGGPR